MMNKKVYLIGAGLMANEYVRVLQAQKIDFTVIGRGNKSAAKLEAATGVKPVIGGIENFLKKNKLSENAYIIIATGTEGLMPTLLTVIKSGAEKILIEKPAAISIEELLANENNLKPFADKIYVAYNRRFYASVIEAQQLIEEDGGLKSMHFEFTEWLHKIEPLQKAPGVKENWFFANSTHVVDLAFYLAGTPLEWKAFSKTGKYSLYKKTNYAGAGITENGTLFSYISNWESAGRWAIELLTEKRRIYLKPLESIGIQLKGTIPIVEHSFDDEIDKQFKPGLYKQMEAFIAGETDTLPCISEHLKNTREIFAKIIND